MQKLPFYAVYIDFTGQIILYRGIENSKFTRA